VEVRITDISVSRVHSLIRMTKKGEVILEDNESKFGTLLLLSKPYLIKEFLPVFVQVGRTVLCI
jgi:hypothetical protein